MSGGDEEVEGEYAQQEYEDLHSEMKTSSAGAFSRRPSAEFLKKLTANNFFDGYEEGTPEYEQRMEKARTRFAEARRKDPRKQTDVIITEIGEEKSSETQPMSEIAKGLSSHFSSAICLVFETWRKRVNEPCCRIPMCTSPKSHGYGCPGGCGCNEAPYYLSIDYDNKDEEGSAQPTIVMKHTDETLSSEEISLEIDDRDMPVKILERLVKHGFDYKLGYSRSKHYIFCLIAMKESTALRWAAIREVDLMLDPDMCVRHGRLDHIAFALAKRTHDKDCPECGGSGQKDPELQGPPLQCGNCKGTGLCDVSKAKMKTDDEGACCHLFEHADAHAQESLPVGNLYNSQRKMFQSKKEELLHLLGDEDQRVFDQKSWDFLWASYNECVDQNVFKHYTEYGGSLFTPAMRLRMMYEMLTDDAADVENDDVEDAKSLSQEETEKLGSLQGAGISLEHLKSNGKHPLWCYFPLNDVTDAKWQDMRSEMAGLGIEFLSELAKADLKSLKKAAHLEEPGWCPKNNSSFCGDLCHCNFIGATGRICKYMYPSMKGTYRIKDYFGERIAFYFAFLLHLVFFGWFLLVLAVPFSWWAYEASDGPDGTFSDSASIAAAATCFVVLVWSVAFWEYWKRKEWRLTVKWGMARSDERNVVWDEHSGVTVVSHVDGHLEKIHHNECMWKVQFFFTSLIAGAFIALMIFLYLLLFVQNRNADAGGNVFLGVLFMVLNEIVIAIYEEVDIALTELENHPSFEAFETSLIVKRILFHFINSVMILGWWAYLKYQMFPCGYAVAAKRSNPSVTITPAMTGTVEYCKATFGEEVGYGTETDTCCLSLKTVKSEAYAYTPGNPLTYVEYATRQAVLETRVFASGWLFARVFIQNLMEWFFPRLIGFICAQGLYPKVLCDMFSDLNTDHDTRHGTEWLTDDGKQDKDAMDFSRETFGIPLEIVKSCEQQTNRPMFFKVIDNVNELAVMFMYCNVFSMAFPLAPVLFVANNVVEFHTDLYRLFDRRRPIPLASAGLSDVWAYVFEGIIYVSVVCNMLWCSYHTNLAKLLSGQDSDLARIIFFTIGTMAIIGILITIQVCIEDKPDDVDDHLARQRKVELRMVSRAGTVEHARRIIQNQGLITDINQKNQARIRDRVRREHGLENEFIVEMAMNS